MDYTEQLGSLPVTYDSGERCGPYGATEATQVPLGHEAQHQELVLITEVLGQFPHLTPRYYHRAACVSDGLDLLSRKHQIYSGCNKSKGEWHL